MSGRDPFDDRANLADRLLALEPQAIAAAFERFRRQLLARSKLGGDPGVSGLEQALHAVAFLSGSVRVGRPTAFVEYVAWCARVIEARGTPRSRLAALLRDLGDVLAERLSEDDGETVYEIIDQAVDSLAMDPVAGAPDVPTALRPARERLVEALTTGNRAAAAALVRDALLAGHDHVKVYLELIEAALREVGRLWEANRISVAHEHMATVIAQGILAEQYPLLPRPKSLRGRAVITGVKGELHQVGMNLVADLLETDGWDCRFLGTNLPVEDIHRAIDETAPDVVGISATMLFSLDAVESLIDAVRTNGPEVRIAVGGAAFRAEPEVWKAVGADGYAADARSAIAMIYAWAPEA